ncbi:predicted protein [Chaetoceros tenuissimus]|uniref:Uncharacterized protein n=1 Tax=Chaetoceros tenuissimus TaxID=426638 RepID=A0AAD3D2F2_9STRA|nr:predicted protein [Chaetoceros tenuissimus]
MKELRRREEDSPPEAPARHLVRSFAKDVSLSLCFCAACVLHVLWLDLDLDGVKVASSSSVDRSIQRNLESLSFPSQAGLDLNGKFHQSSFGGILNPNHPAGARARRHLSQTNVSVPKSPTPNAVQSLSEENIMNLHGHYAHDEHRSPFASFLYNRTKEELEQEQKEYIEKMNQIRQEWGAWDFNDEHPEIRPIANFDKTLYRFTQ